MHNDLKQGDALTPMLFIFFLEYVFRKIRGNQEGLELNVLNQVFACADDVNLLWDAVFTITKNAENLLQARKEKDLELNVSKTEYMGLIWDQHNYE